MITQYFKLNENVPDPRIISQAARLIEQGELVAFPTETVYGLGAGAFQIEAVEKIFQVKGRPPENPLLVHVSSLIQVEGLVRSFPEEARLLMETFWPGPLSIILPAAPSVPEIVRGGKAGVGLRMPDHSAALAFIDQAGPLAAPSANLYGRPSPTNADHVKADLDGKIAAVLDAGETGIGMESTIIEMMGKEYRILRRGGLDPEQIEKALNRKIEIAANQKPHYQTSLKVLLAKDQDTYYETADHCMRQGRKIALVNYSPLEKLPSQNITKQYYINLNDQNVQLYSILREAEELGADFIIFAPLPEGLSGMAASLADRILRAANPEG